MPPEGSGPDRDERAAWLRLTLTPGLGPANTRALLLRFGLPGNLLGANLAQLLQVVPEALAHALHRPADAPVCAAIEATERWLDQAPHHALLTLADADYPQALLALADPPPVLFAAGRRALLNRPTLAIVGSRSATRQGSETAHAFAAHLARAGLTIASGMALGIDAAAHRGALEAAAGGGALRGDAPQSGGAPQRGEAAQWGDAHQASSVGVLGTGVDLDYPARNRALAAEMRAHGMLISELPLGTVAMPHHFPRRNRLIAALSRGVLVVEAALHSGSLITARLGAELGREVFAIPGSIHAPLARGCHRLIRDGAKLVESAQDVLEELHLPGGQGTQTAAAAAHGADRPAGPHAALLRALGYDPVDLDTLAARTSRPAGDLMAALLELELDLQVERLPGNRYQRLGARA